MHTFLKFDTFFFVKKFDTLIKYLYTKTLVMEQIERIIN